MCVCEGGGEGVGFACAVIYVPDNTVYVIWETVFTGQTNSIKVLKEQIVQTNQTYNKQT